MFCAPAGADPILLDCRRSYAVASERKSADLKTVAWLGEEEEHNNMAEAEDGKRRVRFNLKIEVIEFEIEEKPRLGMRLSKALHKAMHPVASAVRYLHQACDSSNVVLTLSAVDAGA